VDFYFYFYFYYLTKKVIKIETTEYCFMRINEIALIEFNNYKNIDKFYELMDFCMQYIIEDDDLRFLVDMSINNYLETAF
jgi:hypothetical protein